MIEDILPMSWENWGGNWCCSVGWWSDSFELGMTSEDFAGSPKAPSAKVLENPLKEINNSESG